MDSKTSLKTPTKQEPKLTPRDIELLMDWQKFTEMSSFKNTDSARSSFGQVKKKVLRGVQPQPGPSTATKSAGKRKATTQDTSPTKKVKLPQNDAADDEEMKDPEIKVEPKTDAENEAEKFKDDLDSLLLD
ncbi:hypothetical protein F5Y04DRAFT_283539 [Hypomontagnella monticulosa]|nr:hypothetical protein F5Y04DRAFT_283539 [Hypomontagnella monticulosa]